MHFVKSVKMKKIPILLLVVFLISTSFYLNKNKGIEIEKIASVTTDNNPSPDLKSKSLSQEIYDNITFENHQVLNFEVFEKAFLGFQNLKKAGKLDEDVNLLTICDFSLSSTQKRLWVIDVADKKVLFNSLVAHGKGTGEEFAKDFSNTLNSYQSSLGFYITQSTYNGSNGYSLRLLGMDKGYNDQALPRAIVMHGADYVSEDFIKAQNRIGRSWGCPAVPRALAKPIINTIKDSSCLFIYYPDEKYLGTSEWLKTEEMANENMAINP